MSRLVASQRAWLAPAWVREDLSRKAQALPSLDLRFAESKSLTDAATGSNLVTFTRSSSGTYVGSDGVLKTATTNLLLRSEEFDNASWNKANTTVTANQATAPDGSANADLIAGNAGTTTKYIYGLYSASTSGAFTFSVFAKAGTESFIVVRITDQGGVNEVRQRFDLSSGTLNGSVAVGGTATAGSSSISAVANGWYRCAVTATFAAFTQLQGNVWLNSYASTALTTNFYLWGAQLEQSSTVGEYIPTTSTINSAPRFDHNPTTGESLGLLVEEQRTNSIRNNTMVGAVAGTPGALPTNWSQFLSPTGITRSVVGTGTENGISYVDIRFNGTASGSGELSLFPESSAALLFAAGTTLSASAWLSIVGGSTVNISSVRLRVLSYNVGTYLSEGQQTVALTSQLSRYTLNGYTTAATSDRVSYGITAQCAAAGAIDITLRIGLPQLEQGAFATSVIPTTGTTATRSADVASITGTNFSSWYRQDEGTMFAEVDRNTAITAATTVVSINDNTTNNRLLNFRQDSASQLTVISQTGGILDGSPQVSLINTSARNKVAAAQALNNLAASANGGTAVGDLSVAMPTVNQMQIGNVTNVSSYNGTIRRLTYWPARLANSTLQAITQ